jgi:PAS domain-containing protein
MKTSKPFSLSRTLRERLDLKIALAILCLAMLFLLVVGFFNYLKAQQEERAHALAVVREMVAVVEGNAAIAAYLKDIQLADEIVSGLQDSRYVARAAIDIDGGPTIAAGDITQSVEADVVHRLNAPFDAADQVGTLRVYADFAFIGQLATGRGRSVLVGQLALLLLVSGALFWVVRRVVIRPLGRVVGQLKTIEQSGVAHLRGISLKSQDEIGYLARNINSLLEKVHQAYLSEAEHNRQIAQLERKFRLIFEGSHAGIVLVDESDRLALVNPAFEAMVAELLPGAGCLEGRPLSQLFREPERVDDILAVVRDSHTSIFCDLMLAGEQEIWLRGVFSII